MTIDGLLDSILGQRRSGPVQFLDNASKVAALRSDITLQPHQERLRREAETSPVRKLLYWQLGSGKSPGAISAAEAAGKPYTAIVPASLRPVFEGELRKFTDRSIPADVMSYSELARGKPVRYPETILADEAHRLRSPGSKQTLRFQELADRARNLVLMTGTPSVNKVEDFAPLFTALTGRQTSPEEFRARYVGQEEHPAGLLGALLGVKSVDPSVSHADELKKLLAGHVDYYAPPKTPVPVNRETVEVDMSPEQTRIYRGMLDQLPWHLRWKLKHDYGLSSDELKRALSFMTGPRQVGLSVLPFLKNKGPEAALQAFESSPKLKTAFERMQKFLAENPAHKAFAFSNFPTAAFEPYGAALQRANIPYGVFHGGLSDEERRKLVSDFNSGRLRAALLGPAGAEGLSLKGVQLSQILDPHFHPTRTDQAAARGLRLDSHVDLPDALRNMRIEHYIAKAPLGFTDRLLSRIGIDREGNRRAADDYLTAMSERKRKELNSFLDVLKEVGSTGRGGVS